MKYFLLSFFLFLSACGGVQINQIPLAEPLIPPFDARPSPIALKKVRFAVPTGSTTVSQSPKGPFGLLFCSMPYGEVHTGITGRGFPSDQLRDIFTNTLDGMGYDVSGSPGRMFDEQDDLARSHYSIGARITDIKMDVCQKGSIFVADRGKTGEAEITIEWSVFDTLHRKSVYKKTLRGYASLRTPNKEAVELLFEKAFEAASHNLGADHEFYDMVFNGLNPAHDIRYGQNSDDEYEGIFDPLEQVKLNLPPISHAPAAGRLEEIVKTAVLIESGAGHGSGFLISQDGHIITNAHVIGRAHRVRVVLSGKRKKLIAEVLRYDRRRDVALLKIEELPEDYDFSLLPIRMEKPKIGEEIYAIGAPLKTALQDSITKGIISRHYYNKSSRQRYIQGDVYITGGNSGGPLIDANGNIIGITVSRFSDTGAEYAGLNNFIPIDDALDQLDIELAKSPGQ